MGILAFGFILVLIDVPAVRAVGLVLLVAGVIGQSVFYVVIVSRRRRLRQQFWSWRGWNDEPGRRRGPN